MWRGFAFKKGVPKNAVDYVTSVLQKVANDPEWENYCNDTYVFSNFEKQEKFTDRIIQEVDETNYYLNKAGLLVVYQKESAIHIILVLVIIAIIVLLLLFALNKFKISNINYDQYIAGGIITISIFFYYQTVLFQIPNTLNVTSPALIPRIWITILILISILLILKSKTKNINKTHYSPKMVLIIIGFLILYLVAMQWIGYYFTTPIFIMSTMYLLKYRKFTYMTINAFGFVLFSYLVFNQLLHIDLPLGWLFV